MQENDDIRNVVAVARAMADETLDLVAGCREIVHLSRDLPMNKDLDGPLNVLRGVESETDGFPIGNVRQRWSSAALAKADREKDAYLAEVRPGLLDACRRLIAALHDEQSRST